MLQNPEAKKKTKYQLRASASKLAARAGTGAEACTLPSWAAVLKKAP